MKDLSEKTFHHEFVAELRKNAVSSSSVRRSCREVILSLNSEEISLSRKDKGLDEVNEAILLALSNKPFSSVQQIAHGICVPKSTIYH
jgi:hypothetical protein